MIQLGKTHILTVSRNASVGVYLEAGENEVLLPNKYVPEDIELGQEIEVFVYTDSEDRPVATTLSPKIRLGECAVLSVVDVGSMGAFLDWGLEKDLLLPFSEQASRPKKGQTVLVYLCFDDKSGRLFATTRIPKQMKGAAKLEEGQEVKLIIHRESELGVQVIVNNTSLGLLYHNEIFQPLEYGSEVIGYIKCVREDGKLDVSLQKPGYAQVQDSQELILKKLRVSNGFLPLTDKSQPELIKSKLHMSKKVFKKAVGALYKEQRITLEADGIRLRED